MRRALFLLIVMTAPALAQKSVWGTPSTGLTLTPNNSLILSAPTPSCIIMQPGISLCSDGTVKAPPGMKMTVAAQKFVDEIKRYWPTVCGLK